MRALNPQVIDNNLCASTTKSGFSLKYTLIAYGGILGILMLLWLLMAGFMPWQSRQTQLSGPFLSQMHALHSEHDRIKLSWNSDQEIDNETLLLGLGFEPVDSDWMAPYLGAGVIRDGEIPYRKTLEFRDCIYHYLVMEQPDRSLESTRFTYMCM